MHPKRIAEIASLIVGSLALSTVVLITVYESVARRVGVPFVGHQEATILIITFIVWISIGYSEIKEGHISMSLILDHMSPSQQRITQLTFSVLMLAICLLAVWPTVNSAIYDWKYQISYTALPWPTWIARAAVPAGLLAFAILQANRISDLLRQQGKTNKTA